MASESNLHKLEDTLAKETVQSGMNPPAPVPPESADSATPTVTGSRPPTVKNGETASTHSGHGMSEKEVPGSIGGGEKPLAEGEHAVPGEGADESGVLTGAKLYLVFLSLMLSVFVSPPFSIGLDDD